MLIYKLLSGWRPPAIPPKHWIPVWALTVWAVFSGAWSASSSAWFLNLCVFGLGIAYFCISGMLLDTPQMVQRYLRAFWVGGLFGSAAGILALFLGTRSVGFGGDPNFFGLLQASMIPLTVYFRRQATDARTKWLYTLALLFVLAGAAGAGSRSGLIGGSIAIVATMVTRPGLDAARRVGVSISAMIMGALAFLVGFVANPANLQRGFSDRGAGRLDLWNVTIELIKQRPLTGYGFGQIKTYIVPNLLTTPGSKWLMDTRTEVSAHNTWLDVTGDLGLIGLAIFVSVFIITLWSLLTPRWKEDRELSTILFVMMLPVLSGSFFLPLLNNKLSWSLIGVAAALQVPSWGARWTGLAGTSASTAVLPAPVGPPGPPGRNLPEPAAAAPVAGFPAPPAVRLARWDLRVSRRFRAWILVGALDRRPVPGCGRGSDADEVRGGRGRVRPRARRSRGTRRDHGRPGAAAGCADDGHLGRVRGPAQGALGRRPERARDQVPHVGHATGDGCVRRAEVHRHRPGERRGGPSAAAARDG